MIELDEIETHDGIWHRGYHIGYARAHAHTEQDFTHRFPLRLLPELVRVLNATGSEFTFTTRVDKVSNQFGVRFVHIHVRFTREEGSTDGQHTQVAPGSMAVAARHRELEASAR